MPLRIQQIGWEFTAELPAATNVITTKPGILHGFLIETNGTNNAVVQFYNHATGATNPLTPSIVIPGGDRYGGAMGIDVPFILGCVCVVSGTGAQVTAYYRLW